MSGTAIARATLLGSPMATAPETPPRRRSMSSRARAIWCRMPRPWSTSNRPASVGVTPRPLRTSRFWRSSTSSRRTCRLRADWAMPRAAAAWVKLPISATRTKYSSCFRSIDK